MNRNPQSAAPRSLVLCTTCRFPDGRKLGDDGRTGGQTLIDAFRTLLADRGRVDVDVVEQACLWNCTQSCSVAVRDDSRFSYITGRHEATREQAEAILQWFDLHGQSETGEVPFRSWPDRMRGHFIARIPPVAR
jgi:predicted metal-binding protein